jgi:hypothetical protein
MFPALASAAGFLRAAILALLIALVAAACANAPPKADAKPAPVALVERLAPLAHDALCEGRLIVEVDRVLVRKYPRPALAPSFRYLPLVVGVLSMPGGPDEGDVTVIGTQQVYSAGDRVRMLEGRTVLDRPVHRLHGLRFELRLANNQTTVTPDWVSYAQAAHGLPGASVPIDIGTQIVRRLERDDVMLSWNPPLDDLIREARRAGELRFRLRTPESLPDGRAAAELDLLVHHEQDPICR